MKKGQYDWKSKSHGAVKCCPLAMTCHYTYDLTETMATCIGPTQDQADQYYSMDRRAAHEVQPLTQELLVVYGSWGKESCSS